MRIASFTIVLVLLMVSMAFALEDTSLNRLTQAERYLQKPVGSEKPVGSGLEMDMTDVVSRSQWGQVWKWT